MGSRFFSYQQVCFYTAFGNSYIFSLLNVFPVFSPINLHRVASGLIIRISFATSYATKHSVNGTLPSTCQRTRGLRVPVVS